MKLPVWLRWRSDRELDEEIQAHLEFEIENNLSRGMTREEARFAALRAFGNPTQVRERARDADPLMAAENLLQDMRHAFRMWSRNPGFALAAVTAIGLGIGINAAVFTLANAVLFKSLAYEGKGHIVYVQGVQPGCELPCDTGRSYPDFREFRAQAKSFDELVAYSFQPVNLSDTRSFPEQYRAMRISANGFRAFQEKPVLGRDFIAADDRPGAPAVAMLTYALWESRYAKSPSIIGKTIRVDEVPTVVVGVMPPEMQFRVSIDLWLPLVPTADLEKRANRSLMILGRLARNATTESAGAELETISRRLETLYPAADKGIGIHVLEAKDLFLLRVRMLFKGLLVAVGLVLLVACANVANLLLGRAVVRSREIAIRVAMGAGRWRVVRQLLAESVLLSIAGGVLGWLLAVWGVRAFDVAIAGTGKPPWLDFSMDRTVFAYISAISIGAGILFGLVPALRLSKVDVHTALKDGGQGASGGSRGRHLSGLLVAGEMAMAVMLLVGTVLVVRTLVLLYRSQIGVNTANVLTLNVNLPVEKYSSPNNRISFYEQLQARLRALPGAESASMASVLPGHGGMSFDYELEGAAPVEINQRPSVDTLVVGPGYFHVMDVHPLAGREFVATDGVTGLPAVIVNRSFAEQSWQGANPVGKRLHVFEGTEAQAWLTVVGVVPDIWQNDLIQREFQPLIYLPFREDAMPGMAIVARTRVPPATLSQAFRVQVQALDQDLPVYRLQTLDEDIRQHDWAVRVFGTMFSIFALAAMAMASMGLYAVVSHAVNQRTHEIGVRRAMGASGRNIVGSVFAQGMLPVTLGLAVGLGAAFALTRALRATLAGNFEPDAGTFLTVAVILMLAGLLACAIPAHRATRVDPMIALRFE